VGFGAVVIFGCLAEEEVRVMCEKYVSEDEEKGSKSEIRK
jgi:hypothetical protein